MQELKKSLCESDIARTDERVRAALALINEAMATTTEKEVKACLRAAWNNLNPILVLLMK
ncbi:hypothetical protein SB768_08030 [Burkholderia sp. SIMBA_043]|uniref:hypothetical protein n=1 Tax=Burkholderia TaxID=32008 RepID=UPI000AD3DEB0|nr:hypothetical protein [Burkholderia vietnamiensis]UBI27552.1 hypothetical protein LA325_15330 [Burkholderia vietnamiensis]